VGDRGTMFPKKAPGREGERWVWLNKKNYFPADGSKGGGGTIRGGRGMKSRAGSNQGNKSGVSKQRKKLGRGSSGSERVH